MRLLLICLLVSVVINHSAYADACYSEDLDNQFSEKIDITFIDSGDDRNLVQVLYPKRFKNKELFWAGFQEYIGDRPTFSVEMTKTEHGENYLSSILLLKGNSGSYVIAAKYGIEIESPGCEYVVKAKIEHNKRLQIDAAKPRD